MATENVNNNGNEAAPKKKKITAVFRPNTQGGPRRGGAGRPGGGRPAGARPDGRGKAPSDKAPARRPITAKSPDQIRDRAAAHNAEKQDELYAETLRRNAEEKAAALKAAEEEKAAAAAAAEAAAKAVEKPAAETPAAESTAPEAAVEAAAPAAEAPAPEARPETAEAPARRPAAGTAREPGRAPREHRPAGTGRPAGGQGRPAGTGRPAGGQGRPAGTGRPAGGQGRPAGTGRPAGPGRPAGGQGRPQGAGRPAGGQGGFRRPAGGGAPAQGGPSGGAQSRGGQNRRGGQNTRGAGDRRGRNIEDKENLKGLTKKQNRKGAFQKPVVKQEEKIKTITLPETITIKALAEMMKIPAAQIIKKLFLAGQVVTLNQEVDYETAEEIAVEYDILCEKEEKIDVIAELLKDIEDPEETLQPRPPVVCVMGHVDHGKTSLLDAIRNTNVISREAGGITQHIGAYMVNINDHDITFLDTPGHEAFTAMRMRGAKSTDIAVLVVAADDGVMPQTVEAINHAKAAEVEIIVAINKIDKPSANVDRVMQELTEYELIPEEWGGSTIFCPVSAKTGEGLENLLEMILLTADVKELRANPDRAVRGLVLEARLDRGKGPVASVLVQKGTLHIGDYVAAGACSGKVRAMINDKGEKVSVAGPSVPVEIQGLNDVPGAGEIIVSLPSDKEAKNYAAAFISEGREKLIEETRTKMSLDDLFNQIKEGNLKDLNLIVKADVQGSVEALKTSLLKLSNEEVVVKIIHSGVGAINESDVTLAATSSAIIIGFNVKPDNTAKSIADQEKVDIRLYNVIYQAIDDVEAAMKGMLTPIYEERVIGHGEVRMTFKASGVGIIAGSYVTDGEVTSNSSARVTRDGEQIFEGKIASLKRFKDDVKKVAKGYECGIVFEGFTDL
ncbi:MAG: translation initiation factor IF-2, partial [Lachnospiraceae bacterium]|nr:translation initiation factor IF-2 [Lachnospiraceae bacterium]